MKSHTFHLRHIVKIEGMPGADRRCASGRVDRNEEHDSAGPLIRAGLEVNLGNRGFRIQRIAAG